jgi:hypothetical protein
MIQAHAFLTLVVLQHCVSPTGMIQAHAFLTNKAVLEPLMVQLPSNLRTPFRTNITLSWAGSPEARPVAFELVHAPSVSMTLQVGLGDHLFDNFAGAASACHRQP